MEQFVSTYVSVGFFRLLIINFKSAYFYSQSKAVFVYTFFLFLVLMLVSMSENVGLPAMAFFELAFFWEFYKSLRYAHSSICTELGCSEEVFKGISPLVFLYAKNKCGGAWRGLPLMLKNSRKWVDVLFMKKGLLERPVFLIFLSIVVGVISGLIGNGATEIFKEVGLKGVGWALLLLVIFLSIPIFMGMFFSVVFDGKYDRSYELSLLLQRIEELNGCEIIQ